MDSEQKRDIDENEELESKAVLQDVEGGDPGVTRDTVEEARRSAPEQAPGLPPRPPEVDPNHADQPLRTEKGVEPPRKNVQDLSGGAKPEFETAQDDREGWQQIEEGMELEGREGPKDLASGDVEEGIRELPADARMNQEARVGQPRDDDDDRKPR